MNRKLHLNYSLFFLQRVKIVKVPNKSVTSSNSKPSVREDVVIFEDEDAVVVVDVDVLDNPVGVELGPEGSP